MVSILLLPRAAFNHRTSGGGSDPLFAYVKSLLHGEGPNTSTTIVDVIGNTWTAYNNAQISTAWSAFGSASINLGFTNAVIQTPDAAALRIGINDFCMEFQIYPQGTFGAYQNIVAKGYVGTGDILTQLSNSNTHPTMTVYFSGAVVLSESVGVNANTKYFYRIRRAGTALSLERDGVVVDTATDSTNLNGTGTLSIGSRTVSGIGTGFTCIAYVDEFRLTIGNARSANVIQTAPWPDHA